MKNEKKKKKHNKKEKNLLCFNDEQWDLEKVLCEEWGCLGCCCRCLDGAGDW